jgi:hypothetical protein
MKRTHWAEIPPDVLQAVLPLARGSYQRDLLLGREKTPFQSEGRGGWTADLGDEYRVYPRYADAEQVARALAREWPEARSSPRGIYPGPLGGFPTTGLARPESREKEIEK